MRSRQLRVAVDLTAVLPGGDNGGAKILTLELLAALGRTAPQHSYLLLTARDSHDEFAPLEALGMERRCVLEARRGGAPRPTGGLRARLARLHRERLRSLVPGAVRRAGNLAWARLRREPAVRYAEPDPRNRGLVEDGVDVLFCPFTAPVRAEPGLPVVSVVYDLQHLAYPQFFTPQERANRDALLRVVADRADQVVCISEDARTRFVERLRMPPERIVTIPIAAHGRLPRLPEPETKAALARLGLLRPYAFYPANFWPHKNHRLLLTAFGALRARRPTRPLDLVLTGALSEPAAELAEAARAMGLSGCVRFLGYRPDRDLAALYEGATLVVFPSLYEGFGMPILEAMHFERPVACSDVTSLPEVAGDAALLFDPRRPESIVDALVRLLDEPGFAASLARRGQARLAALDTSDMARRYLEVFEVAASRAWPHAPTLGGVFPDRWLGGSLALCLPAGGTCELDLFAPPWLGTSHVDVEAVARGRRLGGSRLPRDSRQTFRFEVPGDDRCVEIRLSPLFQPAARGMGDDHRTLSCQCEGARLLDPSGAHDLLSPTLAPATG